MEKLQRQILHIDVNNAFLSWTAIDRLEQGEKLDIRDIEAVIEGCDGVLEYNENVVRLSTGKLVIKFMGRGLILKSMTDTGVIVTGYITSIEFS